MLVIFVIFIFLKSIKRNSVLIIQNSNKRNNKMKLVTIFILYTFFHSPLFAEPYKITGVGEAISGDTLIMDGQVITLKDIVSPKLDDKCVDSIHGEFNCGKVARDKLAAFLYNNFISCELVSWKNATTKYGKCSFEGKSINSLQVLSGWAVAKWYDRDEKKIPLECSVQKCKNIDENIWISELNAVENKRGLWGVQFNIP